MLLTYGPANDGISRVHVVSHLIYDSPCPSQVSIFPRAPCSQKRVISVPPSNIQAANLLLLHSGSAYTLVYDSLGRH